MADLWVLYAAIRPPCKAPLCCRVHGVRAVPGPAAEFGAAVVGKGLLDLGACVHHKGSVLGHGLGDGAALQQQDYLAGALLVALTWVIARTGSDLAVLAERKEDA